MLSKITESVGTEETKENPRAHVTQGAYQRGRPLKGCPSRAKTFPEHEVVVFKLCWVQSPTSLPLTIFLSASMSAFAAPVTHQDQGGCGGNGSSTALSAFSGLENLRFQAVSKWLFQDSWLLANPLVVHGVGSKDGDNQYICWAERLPIILWESSYGDRHLLMKTSFPHLSQRGQAPSEPAPLIAKTIPDASLATRPGPRPETPAQTRSIPLLHPG